eukprot:1143603-Pelagomonas_calceolata.AAC.2
MGNHHALGIGIEPSPQSAELSTRTETWWMRNNVALIKLESSFHHIQGRRHDMEEGIWPELNIRIKT